MKYTGTGFSCAMAASTPAFTYVPTMTPIAEALTRPKLRDQAYQYLVELAPRRSSLFTPQLEDPDPRVRADAVDILALAGDAAALPLVERLLADRDSQVVKAAERAVARLRPLQRKPIS